MSRLIGYYVHHQGDGHRQRALAIARHASQRMVLLGTGLMARTGEVPCVDLNDDRPEPAARFQERVACDSLHYVPLDHEGVRRRVALLAGWMATHRPALMVVDVSVEVAMLARLASTPVAYVRLCGARDDAAHLQAFRSARVLIAPFHSDLDHSGVPAWVRDKTRYLPGLTLATKAAAPAEDVILVVNGAGGGALDGAALAAAATATPEFSWRVIGPAVLPAAHPANLTFCGWVANAEQAIANAAVVVGSAGDGVVNAVIAAQRPYICLPQTRAYDEQFFKARRLAALGAAVTLEHLPESQEWPDLIRRAQSLNPHALARLSDTAGVQKAAQFLIMAADAG